MRHFTIFYLQQKSSDKRRNIRFCRGCEILFIRTLFLVAYHRNEGMREASLSSVLYVDITDKAKQYSTYEIDKHILHRIAKSDVYIAVYPDCTRGCVDIGRNNIGNMNYVVRSLGIENDRIYRRDK